ncbi:DUF4386 family protein [Micromonospora sp. HM134]|uniref:DUF4386 family protein n=1 Tax=Micromonospora sp. HM134 TaxID=2583243 RepID=UPI0011983F61|nr:DUF4386 family protein [Micromonospora sp. HM134]QDY08174.1 DUF4386 family protein [Micromonospora sp. HM134]
MSLRVTGRWAGAFFLSAFVAYGVGSALAGRPAGVALVLANSVLVAAIGVLAFRALRRPHPGVAWLYLVTRGAEAFLLAAGLVLRDRYGDGAADLAYQLAMLALGLGSVPFCLALARRRWLPRWFAGWGTAGYALLAAGAVAALAGVEVGVAPAVPGGLFEVAFGVVLLVRGFAPATAATGPAVVGPDDSRAHRAALAAGAGLLLMAVLAGWANFGVVQPLLATDAAGIVTRLPAQQRALTLAVVALFTVACLDVLVGWALAALLRRTHRAVALLAAWCRTGYAVILAVAVTHLTGVAGLLRDSAGADRLHADGYPGLADFQQVWDLGLLLFGGHLLLVGWLAWRSDTVPTWVAALVAVAGAGYLADAVGPLLSAGYPVQVSGVTFVGEVVLMGWLLVHAARPGRSAARRIAPDATARPLSALR